MASPARTCDSADTCATRLSCRGARPVRHRQLAAALVEHERAVLIHQAPAQEVHLRAAQEAGDEVVDRQVIDLQRRSALLDHAVLHDHDPIAQRHRLFLIVGDVDGGAAQAHVQALDLGAHVDAQLGVQVGQRLVEQEALRIAHDGAPQRDALALAARQRARLAVEQALDAQDAGGALHALVDVRARELAHLQRERHVLAHRHVRVQRVALEHHRDVAVLGRNVVDQLVADVDLAGGRLLKAGDHP